jgi:hypothetical protein
MRTITGPSMGLWAFTACYRESFTFTFTYCNKVIIEFQFLIFTKYCLRLLAVLKGKVEYCPSAFM